MKPTIKFLHTEDDVAIVTGNKGTITVAHNGDTYSIMKRNTLGEYYDVSPADKDYSKALKTACRLVA